MPLTKKRKPLVSVVLPVYNVAPYLAEALDSILAQTFTDFEVSLVNDGSTDQSGEIANAYARKDSRICVIHQENRGLVGALNRGLEHADGEFIARMDGDDISLPNRFERQLKLLEAHPEIGVCGSWMESFGDGRCLVRDQPSTHEAIRCKLLFRTAISHPTVMMRKAILDQHKIQYDPNADHAEDYDLWVRLSHITKLANIDEVLHRYRLHPGQFTMLTHHNDKTTVSCCVIYRSLLRRMGLEPQESDLEQHVKVVSRKFEREPGALRAMELWLRKLAEANRQSKAYSEPEFGDTLARIWWPVCQSSTIAGLPALSLYLRSPISSRIKTTPKSRVKFALKCLIRRPSHVWEE